MPDISAQLEVIRTNPYGESVKTAVRDALSILAESRGGDIVEELPHGVVNDSRDGLYGSYKAGVIQPSPQLFDRTGEIYPWNEAELTFSGSTIRATVQRARTQCYAAILLSNTPQLLGKTLTLSATITQSTPTNTGGLRVFWYNGNYPQIAVYQDQPETGYATATFIVANWYGTCEIGDYVDYENVMLNVGTEALPYEPYHGIPDA